MRSRLLAPSLSLSLSGLVAACGPATQHDPQIDSGGGTGDPCETSICTTDGWQECRGGRYQAPVACVDPTPTCVAALGCRLCQPDMNFCSGPGNDEVWVCSADGNYGGKVGACESDEECRNGVCVSACARAAEDRSNIGCEYWAVDLPNEANPSGAAGAQFAVALANTSDFDVDVLVELNSAAPGEEPSLYPVREDVVPAQSLLVLNLAPREVDGTDLLPASQHDNATFTRLSANAYRISTGYPVVAYQFNPIVQAYSNGASLLIPTSGLDSDYWVLSWPTANPVDVMGDLGDGVPDHSYVTIIGVTEQPVHVTVTVSHPTLGQGTTVPAAAAGGTVEADLRAFDVLNIASAPDFSHDGDLTATRVQATGPVAVFSSGERWLAPGYVKPPWNGGGEPTRWCCTEHSEQQMFPTTSLGKQFVVTRSPVRSTNPSNPEGDVYRVLATEPDTVVTTNLVGEFATFTLASPGDMKEFWATHDFVLESTEPIVFGQFLVSDEYVDSPSVGGDPDFILFPPVEQFRTDVLFLNPATFDADYAIIAAPENANVRLDDEQVNTEFDPICEIYPAGPLAGTSYVAIRCPVADGVHRVVSDQPVGVTAYGYYSVGSYGYAAGAELKRINPIE